MIITLTNNLNNRSVQFMDYPHFNKLFPFCMTFQKNISTPAQQGVYLLANYSGFTDNNVIENWTREGISQNGEVFKTNNFQSKLLQWNFHFDNSQLVGKDTSTQNILNSVLMSKNTPLLLEVETLTGNKFKMDVYVSDQTSTENGTIQVISANDGVGIYFKKDKPTTKLITPTINDCMKENSKPFLPLKLPQSITEKRGGCVPGYFKSIIETFNETQLIEIKVGHDYDTFYECTIINSTNKTQMTVINYNEDKYLIIDPLNKTIVNEYGQDRIDCLVTDGSQPLRWLKLENGINEVSFAINMKKGEPPADFEFAITYDNLYTSIF